MNTRIVCTVCYPWRRFPDGRGGYRDEILLGRHKDTPGARRIMMVDKWNGFGGKFKPGIDLSIDHAAQRETEEECGITPVLEEIVEAGVILFRNPGIDVEVHFSFSSKWTGDAVSESDEMYDIRWWPITRLPYEEMMDADRKFFLPMILHGALVRGEALRTTITHDEGMRVVHADPNRFEKRASRLLQSA